MDEAEEALRGGGLVVMPTDTVYGLAALPGVAEAVEALFAAKGRPENKAIPVLGASAVDLKAIAVFDGRANRIAARFWPGPLTLVLPRSRDFTVDLGGADPETVAVRVPAHDVALDLLDRCGPLAVTSANRSGEPDAVTVQQARAALGDSAAVYVDAGECGGGPSTIASLVGDLKLLRLGSVDERELRASL
jgi:tRNA threonylcarbamoyl adenosine modification protein (Sua5/YciO/YrdC/YwlC family)